MLIAQGIIGLSLMIGLCWLFSENRQNVHLPIVAKSLGLQILFAITLLTLPASQQLFVVLNDGITVLRLRREKGLLLSLVILAGASCRSKRHHPAVVLS